MKTRNAASTILMSLVAAGCGTGDGDYVSYKDTAPADVNQNVTQPDNVTEIKSDPQGESSGTNSGVAAKSDADVKTVDSNVKPASHSSSATDVAASESPVIAKSAPLVKSIVSPQTGLTGPADVPVIDTGTTEASSKIELLIPNKSFRRERGTDAVRINYDDIDLLKVLNMEPVPPNAPKYFPEWLAGLDGKRIRIRGWMYPTFVSEGLTSFTMARDNGICCFQRMPKIYDVIFVKLDQGEQTDYIDQRPFDVEGTFRIDSEGDGSELPRLYKIENARVLD